MNPFCCVSTVSDRNPATPHSPLADLFNMAPPPPMPPPAATSLRSHSCKHRGSSPKPSSATSSSSVNHNGSFRGIDIHNHSNGSSNHSVDNGRPICRSVSAVSESLFRLPSLRDHREVMINDIVGNGISGVLYKWVNYGKGWRPRWFVLQDGVLSYYKIHGPDKIVINQETEKGCKIIGEESFRRVSHPRRSQSETLRCRKPFGEIHLKVILAGN